MKKNEWGATKMAVKTANKAYIPYRCASPSKSLYKLIFLLLIKNMSDNKHLVPICIIYVDGVRLSTACEGAFRSVKAFDVMNKISECFISFDWQDLGDENAKDFPFNANVSVHLGYKDDVNEVFNGEITAQKISHSQYSPSIYTVKVSSLLHHLNHGMHKRTFENKTPSQGIKDILSRYNLQADSARHDFLVTDTGRVHGYDEQERPYGPYWLDENNKDDLPIITRNDKKFVDEIINKLGMKKTGNESEYIWEETNKTPFKFRGEWLRRLYTKCYIWTCDIELGPDYNEGVRKTINDDGYNHLNIGDTVLKYFKKENNIFMALLKGYLLWN
jgi:hypothetical protein